MKGARTLPSAPTMWGRVGGAFRRSGNRSPVACGARSGAPIAASTTRRTSAPPASLARTGVDENERDIRQERAAREEDGPGRRTSGHQKQVAGAQRLEGEPAEAWPGRHDLHGERAAQ